MLPDGKRAIEQIAQVQWDTKLQRLLVLPVEV
jgi:hypothetical protein